MRNDTLTGIRRAFLRRWMPVFAAFVACFHLSAPAHAQVASSVDVRATLGWRDAITESACSTGGGQFMGGGSARYHFTPRFSAGGEVLFVKACRSQTFTFYHPSWSGMVQFALDLNEGRSFRPYVIGAAGILGSRSIFGNRARFEAAGGAGVKFFISDRVFVAPEIQMGGEVWFLRMSGSVGILLGPR